MRWLWGLGTVLALTAVAPGCSDGSGGGGSGSSFSISGLKVLAVGGDGSDSDGGDGGLFNVTVTNGADLQMLRGGSIDVDFDLNELGPDFLPDLGPRPLVIDEDTTVTSSLPLAARSAVCAIESRSNPLRVR